MAEHSELSASGAKIWWNCPGSVRLSRGIERHDTAHSIEGTVAHKVAEVCLSYGMDAAELIDREVSGHIVDDDMAEDVQVYVDFVRSLPGDLEIEKRVRLDDLNPPAPMYGTCDAFLYDATTHTLHIVDLKYGKGVWVPAEDNQQLRYYALGALLALPFEDRITIERVTMTIAQPRNARGGAVRTATISLFDIRKWSDDLMGHARAALEPNAPLVPGEWCQFCPARGGCPARSALLLQEAQLALGSLEDHQATMQQAVLLTPDELGALLTAIRSMEAKADALAKLAADAKALAASELKAGRDVPGWKLVQTEGRAKWCDTDDAEFTLDLAGVPAYAEPTLVSPAQARGRLVDLLVTTAKENGEKLTKKAAEAKARGILTPLLHKPKYATLAPADDERLALTCDHGLEALPDETQE